MRRTRTLSILAILLASTLSTGQTVLILDDGSSVGIIPGPAEAACIALGLTYTVFDTFAAFDASLTSSPPDLAIVTHINFGGVPTSGHLDNIRTHLLNDRKLIFGSWNLVNQGQTGHPLFASMETQVTTFGISATDMRIWDPGNPLIPRMSDPETYQDIVGFGVDAIPANAILPATAIMGFNTPTTSMNNGAVIVRGNKQSVYLAQFPHMMGPGGADGDIFMEDLIRGMLGPSCGITDPLSGTTVTDDVTITFNASDPELDPLTGTVEYSIDAGVTWLPCLATAASPLTNPFIGITTPAVGLEFIWDSDVDAVGLIVAAATQIRISLTDGSDNGLCKVNVTVDNEIPLPVCMITAPVGTQFGPVEFDLVLLSINGPTVNFLAEWSGDAGVTWNMATAHITSQWPNPAMGVPVGLTTWTWDSVADGAATGGLTPGFLMRLTADDGAAPPGVIHTTECISNPFDVDNTSLCGGICGDCNVNFIGPDVLDALTAAQLSAGLGTPTVQQMGCCDINSSGFIDIVDALGIAQEAAGLLITLTCP